MSTPRKPSWRPRSEVRQVGARGILLEARRRLRPLGRAIEAFLGRLAPYVSAGLLLFAGAVAHLIVAVLEATLAAGRWLRSRLAPPLAAIGRLVAAGMTPVATVAAVTAVAAVALGVSQFLDYRGVAVGGELYRGEVRGTAPAPLTDVETTGSAHLYAMLPLAAAALALIALTAAGRWRLGRIVAVLGLIGIVVSIAIDVPQGLDAGTAGFAFASSDPELLKGFWIQLACSAVLLVCGLLLGSYVRAARRADHEPASRRSVDGRAEAPRQGPPATPGWQARA